FDIFYSSFRILSFRNYFIISFCSCIGHGLVGAYERINGRGYIDRVIEKLQDRMKEQKVTNKVFAEISDLTKAFVDETLDRLELFKNQNI
ncbi:MAG: hypothetical protein K6G68_08255, partial [Oscillospiraceae bacterium]|nr:hypothetical protein [Oscillospiraceae bacterium]